MPRRQALLAAAAAAALTAGSPVIAEPVQTVPAPRVRAEDVMREISPYCAQLVETIRSRSAARTTRPEEITALARDYTARCQAEVVEARKRVGERQKLEAEQRHAVESAKRAERERAELQQQQCAELSRILRGRRERAATMNDGERADLARFEQVHRERCLRG